MQKIIGIFVLLAFLTRLHGYECHTLSDVLALSLMKNPELSAFNYEVRAAEARILQASVRPNPALDIETENINAPHFTQTTFLLNQVIEIGGKWGARVRFAKDDRDKTALEYDVKKRELYVETTLLFIDALVNQQKIVFLEEYVKTLEEFSINLKRRVEAGKASCIEEANFSIVFANAKIELQNAMADLTASKKLLAAQWAEINSCDFQIVGELNETPQIVCLEEMEPLLCDHPKVMLFNAESTLRKSGVMLEKSRAFPDVAVRGGPRYLREADKWVWVVGVFMPLPVVDRNQGRICEAVAFLEKLEAEREALLVDLTTELNLAYILLQNACTELSLLKNTVLPASQNAFQACYQGYEVARYNYSELIETERAYRTTQLHYLEALGDYHKAVAQIEGLTGGIR